MAWPWVTASVLAASAASACLSTRGQHAVRERWPTHEATSTTPRASASTSFRSTWFDGTAELSGYRMTIARYGELRTGELVLTYVTEPMNRRTRIKDDDAPPADRIDVLKLNANLTFLTGIYPYSVMTSVFSPIDDWGPSAQRFAPVKITLTAQEWCGHVFHALWPGSQAVAEELASYFTNEGETTRRVPLATGAVYEDALLIQLRELDGAFAGGGTWEGALIPSLWRLRRAHVPLAAVQATITRESTERDGAPITRFILLAGSYRRTFEVERAGSKRILGWSTSDGEEARLLDTARLPYWQLNHAGDVTYRRRLGLPVDLYAPAAPPPPGTVEVGR